MIAWAIVMRLVGDHIHRVFLAFVPVSTVMTYGSAALLIGLIRWAKLGKPRGYLVAWLQRYFRAKAQCAHCGSLEMPYLIEDEQ